MKQRKTLYNDDSGLTPVVEYVLLLAISFLVVSGIVIGSTVRIEEQKEASIEDEFDIIVERVALDLTEADDLYQTIGEQGNITLQTEVPKRAVNTPYVISVTETSRSNIYNITAETETGNVEASTIVYVSSGVENKTVSPDPSLVVVSNDSSDKLVVKNGG